MIKEEGIYKNVPASEYRSWEAFSITTGCEILRSPGHYYYRLHNPIEATPQMELGTLVHLRLLEPDTYSETYVIAPSDASDKRTKVYKELLEKTLAAGKKLIDYNTAIKVESIYLNVMAKEPCREFLSKGDNELSLVWKEGDILCKGRIDKVYPDMNILIDIKTTSNADSENFKRAVFNNNYHIQAAHYRAGARKLGIEIDHVILMAVENVEPYGVVNYRLSEKSLEIGDRTRAKMLDLVAECQFTNCWNLYPDEVLDVEPPAWLLT